jgi:phosphopantothenate-cysteine ligase
LILLHPLYDYQNYTLVKQDYIQQLTAAVQALRDAEKDNRILVIEFETVIEYLWYLRAVSSLLQRSHAERGLIFASAAVSDFYIPSHLQSEHKIQSSTGSLELSLHTVPKMLFPLTKHWAPSSYVVTFKVSYFICLFIF